MRTRVRTRQPKRPNNLPEQKRPASSDGAMGLGLYPESAAREGHLERRKRARPVVRWRELRREAPEVRKLRAGDVRLRMAVVEQVPRGPQRCADYLLGQGNFADWEHKHAPQKTMLRRNHKKELLDTRRMCFFDASRNHAIHRRRTSAVTSGPCTASAPSCSSVHEGQVAGAGPPPRSSAMAARASGSKSSSPHLRERPESLEYTGVWHSIYM